jgi:hypothetical protein
LPTCTTRIFIFAILTGITKLKQDEFGFGAHPQCADFFLRTLLPAVLPPESIKEVLAFGRGATYIPAKILLHG